jgi:hypothetical protein
MNVAEEYKRLTFVIVGGVAELFISSTAPTKTLFDELFFAKKPVLNDSLVGPSFLTYTVTGKFDALLEKVTWSMLRVLVVPPELLVDAPMNPMTYA